MYKAFVALFAAFLILSNSLSADPVFWTGNGHYYELVPGNINWPKAKADAEARVFNGMHGHLATITSSEENNFIAGSFGISEGGRFVWIAGREPKDDGIWIWDSGPEGGIQFSTGRTATAPFFFANWGGIEPNDFKEGEDYLMFNIGTDFAEISRGQWADAIATPNPTDPVLGYIVEYGPETGPRLLIKHLNSETVEISFQTAPGRSYQLQSVANVNATSWSNIGGSLAGNGSVIAVLQSILPENRWYRLELLKP